MPVSTVGLTNAVNGILPVANGGTGTSTGVSPGGSTTQVQYNNAGAFGGSANLVFNGTGLTVGGAAVSGLFAVGTTSYAQQAPTAQINATSLPILNNAGIFNIGSTNAAAADVGGSLGFTANGAVNGYSTGQISGRRESATSSSYGSYMSFATTAGNSAITEKLRIDSTGNLKLIQSGTSILNSSGNKILNQTGSVLQVVNGTISTAQSTSSASAQNSGLNAIVTPSSSSNKVFITISSVCGQNYSGRSEFLYLYKNGAQVFRYELFLNTVSSIPITITYLDSPATTSATTYALWFSADGLGPASVSIGNTVSSITLMEIAG